MTQSRVNENTCSRYNVIRMTPKLIIVFIISFLLLCCGRVSDQTVSSAENSLKVIGKNTIINESGMTIRTRFNPPDGFKRMEMDKNSFAYFLRELPLKPTGSKVRYYNGNIKEEDVYDAVVNMDIGNKDLQQCADAVIRLRAEYFYSQREFDKISFNLTNGFKVDYSEWMQGNRVMINGNKTSWKKITKPSNTYKDFKEYLDLVFTYAGTLSLSKEMVSVNKLEDIQPGDVFIFGGSPGHAVIVIDVAQSKTGEKVFLLAQSYMPAQEIHILKNFNDKELSPWYSISQIKDKLKTPEWEFSNNELKRFK